MKFKTIFAHYEVLIYTGISIRVYAVKPVPKTTNAAVAYVSFLLFILEVLGSDQSSKICYSYVRKFLQSFQKINKL
jgi:hypothetical protein